MKKILEHVYEKASTANPENLSVYKTNFFLSIPNWARESTTVEIKYQRNSVKKIGKMNYYETFKG